MSTMQINIKEARQRLSELVNAVALGRERIVITSRTIPKAVIVSLQDAETLETDAIRRARRRIQMEFIRKLRLRLAKKGVTDDSLGTLKKLREERLGTFSNDN